MPAFEEIVARYGFTISVPGAHFWYSNLGYALLGYAISKITQRPLATFMEKEIFNPLGMHTTTFDRTAYADGNLATGYDMQGEALPDTQCDTPAAGSACSTSGDMMRYALFLLGYQVAGSERILSEEVILRIMRENDDSSRIPYLEDSYYCLGFFYKQRKDGLTEVWHEGGWDGASTLLKTIPEEKLAVVSLINTFDSVYVNDITNRIVAAVMGLEKEEKRAFPAGTPDRATPQGPIDLVGTWEVEIKTYAGAIPIRMRFAQDGGIQVCAGEPTESSEAKWVPFQLYVSTAAWVMGVYDGIISTEDTQRYPHQVRLSLEKDGEKLIGEATTIGSWDQDKQSRMYAGLSHYVEMVRLNNG